MKTNFFRKTSLNKKITLPSKVKSKSNLIRKTSYMKSKDSKITNFWNFNFHKIEVFNSSFVEDKLRMNKKITLPSKVKSKSISNLIGIIFIFGIILMLNLVSALDVPEYNVCCEKTESNAWCQNTPRENCDDSFRITPTSCDASGFCSSGCCIDTDEGLCMENTPEKVCENTEGTWVKDEKCSVKQCELGCCVLGDEASFVTLTRCKKLSGQYGLETDFRREVGDEQSCIALAHSQDKGACVYEGGACEMTTRAECSSDENGTSEFYKDYLCTNDELATNCGPTTETMCVNGDVYFKDTCGNPANIYDANKIYSKDNSYWQEIVLEGESCGAGENNLNSKICGNCDYFQSSMCMEGSASYGDYVCGDLSCEVEIEGEEKTMKNGESWCEYQSNTGDGSDAVGSRHYRHLCINGEEIIEPCADYRKDVCIETETEGFTEAACRLNRWTNCMDQDEEDDCLNTDKRDCYWFGGYHFTGGSVAEGQSSRSFQGAQTGGFSGGVTGQAVAPITGKGIFGGGDEESESGEGVQIGGGICLPRVTPGLKFWQDGNAQTVCSMGNSKCVVEYEDKLVGGEDCVDNCECLEESWAGGMNEICTSLGDCGSYTNIAGKITNKGYEWKVDGDKKTIGKGILNEIKKKAGVKYG